MRIVLVMTLAAGAYAAAARMNPPSVGRFETVGATNLMAPVGTPYVAPGQTKEYSIYGHWLDYASTVTLGGVPQTIVEKKGLYNADGALLRVRLSVPAGTARGQRNLAITIGCPPIPFTDCRNVTLTRPVMVLRVGTITSISPNRDIPAAERDTFRVTGTGLDVAKLHFRTHIKQTGTLARDADSFDFSGYPVCGMNVVMLRDEAEGGDVYPYSGVLNVYTTTQCGYQPPPSTLKSVSCPTGQVYNATTKTCYTP